MKLLQAVPASSAGSNLPCPGKGISTSLILWSTRKEFQIPFHRFRCVSGPSASLGKSLLRDRGRCGGGGACVCMHMCAHMRVYRFCKKCLLTEAKKSNSIVCTKG